eukprot:GHVN01055420.1.p1 GENE.GHVN01055420.1~~GHVN01055420.1.p1  ORF type:complete len:728 (+),score=71.70 GHVN01055420.1:7536-9719(+)
MKFARGCVSGQHPCMLQIKREIIGACLYLEPRIEECTSQNEAVLVRLGFLARKAEKEFVIPALSILLDIIEKNKEARIKQISIDICQGIVDAHCKGDALFSRKMLPRIASVLFRLVHPGGVHLTNASVVAMSLRLLKSIIEHSLGEEGALADKEMGNLVFILKTLLPLAESENTEIREAFCFGLAKPLLFILGLKRNARQLLIALLDVAGRLLTSSEVARAIKTDDDLIAMVERRLEEHLDLFEYESLHKLKSHFLIIAENSSRRDEHGAKLLCWLHSLLSKTQTKRSAILYENATELLDCLFDGCLEDVSGLVECICSYCSHGLLFSVLSPKGADKATLLLLFCGISSETADDAFRLVYESDVLSDGLEPCLEAERVCGLLLAQKIFYSDRYKARVLYGVLAQRHRTRNTLLVQSVAEHVYQQIVADDKHGGCLSRTDLLLEHIIGCLERVTENRTVFSVLSFVLETSPCISGWMCELPRLIVDLAEDNQLDDEIVFGCVSVLKRVCCFYKEELEGADCREEVKRIKGRLLEMVKDISEHLESDMPAVLDCVFDVFSTVFPLLEDDEETFIEQAIATAWPVIVPLLGGRRTELALRLVYLFCMLRPSFVSRRAEAAAVPLCISRLKDILLGEKLQSPEFYLQGICLFLEKINPSQKHVEEIVRVLLLLEKHCVKNKEKTKKVRALLEKTHPDILQFALHVHNRKEVCSTDGITRDFSVFNGYLDIQ